MNNIRGEREVKKAINAFVHEGTPAQLQELSVLLCRKKSWKYKRKSLLTLIAKHHNCSS